MFCQVGEQLRFDIVTHEGSTSTSTLKAISQLAEDESIGFEHAGLTKVVEGAFPLKEALFFLQGRNEHADQSLSVSKGVILFLSSIFS